MNWNIYFKIMLLVNQVAVILMDGRITLQEALGILNMGLNMADINLPGEITLVTSGDNLKINVGGETWMMITRPMLDKLKIDIG